MTIRGLVSETRSWFPAVRRRRVSLAPTKPRLQSSTDHRDARGRQPLPHQRSGGVREVCGGNGGFVRMHRRGGGAVFPWGLCPDGPGGEHSGDLAGGTVRCNRERGEGVRMRSGGHPDDRQPLVTGGEWEQIDPTIEGGGLDTTEWELDDPESHISAMGRRAVAMYPYRIGGNDDPPDDVDAPGACVCGVEPRQGLRPVSMARVVAYIAGTTSLGLRYVGSDTEDPGMVAWVDGGIGQGLPRDGAAAITDTVPNRLRQHGGMRGVRERGGNL